MNTEFVKWASWEAFTSYLEAHAELGYPADLPAPEVLERPGWRVVMAEPDVDSWEMHVATGLLEPPSAIPLSSHCRTVIIRPGIIQVDLDPFRSRAPWKGVRLGFDVGQRVLVLFPYR